MRVAALNDIHGNLPALSAVLAEVEDQKVDAIVVGGDVLWGPFQAECLAALRAAGALFLAGNCERLVLSASDESNSWCRERLAPDELQFVSDWPATVELDVEGLGRVLFCHATPRSDEEVLTRITPDSEVAAAFFGVEADVVVCGHTHVQYDRRLPAAPRLVNAGSVGLPYEGKSGAFWAILGPEVQLRGTTYDVDRAFAALTSSQFPDAGEIFGESLRGEASADSATEHFESKRRGA